MPDPITIGLLGPLEVAVGGRMVGVSRGRRAGLLALLAIHADQVVPLDRLIDGLWGEVAPPAAAKTVHAHVSHLRKLLGREAIETQSGGYVLRLNGGQIDTRRFESLVEQARAEEPMAAGRTLAEALDLWRGAAYSDFAYEAFAQAETSRLEELRLCAREDLAEAELAVGHHRQIVAELEALVQAYPFRERLCGALMLALYRCGRQAEALTLYQTARRALEEQLGLAPGVELRQLEQAILRQDPRLDTPTTHAAGAPLADDTGKERRGRMSHLSLAAALAILVTAGGAVTGFLMSNDGGARAPIVITYDSLGLLTEDGHVRVVAPVGAAPSALAVGGGWTWVANRDDNTVTGINPRTNERMKIPVGSAPTGVAYYRGSVWVAESGSGTVDRIDPSRARVVKTIPTGNGPQGVTVDAGRVWVSNSLDATVSEINPETNTVARQISAGPDPTAIAAAGGTIWITNSTSNTVTRLSARSGHPLPAVTVGDGPDALALNGSSLWVANAESANVSRISVDDARVKETLPAGLAPRAIAVAAGTVWVGDGRGSLLGLHPSAPSHPTRAALIGAPLALAGKGGAVWATFAGPLTGHRGGTLRALAEFSPTGPLDVAMNYNALGWQVVSMTNDGLTGFRHVSGPQGETVVPDLATTMPQVGEGGRTYTFEVRRGIRYSNGQPVRPSDFRWELERVFDAGLADGLYDNIVGAAACERSPPIRCDLRRGIDTDDSAGTVTFHLTRPDPDFPAKLALPFAAAVPQSAPVPHYCARETCGYTGQPQPLPATGPYMLVSTTLDFGSAGKLVLVRNPYFQQWSADAQPSGYPDRVAFRFGQTPDAEANAVEYGAADWSSDLPPPKTLAHLLAVAPDQVHRETVLGTAALALNTRRPPFNSTRARQAFNYAIDRASLTRISTGFTGQPTCQILPPGILGYVPYCPYTRRVLTATRGSWSLQNLDRARRLVRASGTAGTHVTIWLQRGGIYAAAPTSTGVSKFGEVLVATLRKIGYPSNYHSVGGTPVAAQVANTFWYDDYPSPSNFLQLLFSCAAKEAPTTASGGYFCSPNLDRRMSHALQSQAIDPTGAAAQWTQVDHTLTNEAPWVPLYTPSNTYIVSRRVRNYEYNPQLYILLDQLWVR